MNYDLNIDNYTKKDLINFLNLPEIYEENMLLQKKDEFITNIKNVDNTDEKNKMIIINFINEAVDKTLKDLANGTKEILFATSEIVMAKKKNMILALAQVSIISALLLA
jgi:GMP synthase PP-ATPase subunit